MTAVVNDVIDAIETLWEAETPTDDTGTTYQRYEGRYEPGGTAGDRAFWFTVSGSGVTGERGASLTERQWEVHAYLLLSAAGRNMKTLQAAVANEGNLLLRAIEADAFSGVSGLIAVETIGFDTEEQDGGDVLLDFTINAHTQESD